MVKIIDPDFLDVMRHLPEAWQVDRWDRGGMGWVATISSGCNTFRLCSDRGYIGVEKVIDGKAQRCEPAPHLRLEISAMQVAELILSHASNPKKPS